MVFFFVDGRYDAKRHCNAFRARAHLRQFGIRRGKARSCRTGIRYSFDERN